MADTITKPSDRLDPSTSGDIQQATAPERELIARIDRYVEESREQREQLQDRWIKALRYWRGDQWRDRKQRTKRGKQLTQAVINKVFPFIEQQIAMMTDNNPTGVFLPKDMSDSQFTKDLSELVHWRARRINMRAKLIRGCHNAKLFGFQAMYVFWDDSLPGEADVNARLLDPRELIIDPLLDSSNPEDGEYIGIERKVTLDYMKYRWPDHADKLQADYEAGSDDYHAISDTTSLDEELGNTSRHSNIQSADTNVDRPLVNLVSMWHRDYSENTYEIPTPVEVLVNEGKVVTNPAGQYVYANTGELWTQQNSPLSKVKEPAYPYGRCTIKADNIILEDFPWGLDYRDGQVKAASWPIALGINTVIPHRWYGMDETEQMVGRQDVINDTVSRLEDHLEFNLHPRMKAETDAVTNPKKIYSTPDTIVWMKPGRIKGMEWQYPPSLSSDAYNLLELSDRSIEDITAMPSATRGQTPKRQSTATEIAILDRAGRGRVGMASALLDEYISRVFLLMAQCIQQNYDEGRVIRIVGDGGKDRSVQIAARHKDVRYDVEIEAGSTMPYDKDAKRQQALELNNVLQGAYLPELLDAYEVKNKQEVLQRHQMWQMFQQYAPLLQNPQVQQMLQQIAAKMPQGEPQ